MGANAQTTVPTFTASQVLTADQMNQSARTGVPVFATTTARDDAFGGTGEKTLAEGQLCYVENLVGDAQIQYYDGSAWNSLIAGLTLITSQTIGSAVSSVTVSSAFSSTYDNYKIMVSPGSSGGGAALLNITFGATATNYYWGFAGTTYSTGAASNSSGNNTTSIPVGVHNTNGIGVSCDVISPNLAKNTIVFAPFTNNATNQNAGIVSGFLNDTTAYTAFTITCASGSLTGGTIKVYGYRN